jgi:hypothetical protein
MKPYGMLTTPRKSACCTSKHQCRHAKVCAASRRQTRLWRSRARQAAKKACHSLYATDTQESEE